MEDAYRTASVLSSMHRHAGPGNRISLRRDVYMGCIQLTAHPSASPPVPLGNTTRRRQNRERILLVFQAWIRPWGVGGETVEGEQSTRCACACSGRLPPAAQRALRRAGRPDTYSVRVRGPAAGRVRHEAGQGGARGRRSLPTHPRGAGGRARAALRPTDAHGPRLPPPGTPGPGLAAAEPPAPPRPRLPAGTDRGWFELVRLHDDVLSV